MITINKSAATQINDLIFQLSDNPTVARYHIGHLGFLLNEIQGKMHSLKRMGQLPDTAFDDMETFINIAMIYAHSAKTEIEQQEQTAAQQINCLDDRKG